MKATDLQGEETQDLCHGIHTVEPGMAVEIVVGEWKKRAYQGEVDSCHIESSKVLVGRGTFAAKRVENRASA